MASEPIRDEPKKGRGSSDNNLRDLIVFFVVFFAVFFVVGFNNGRKDLSKPESIRAFVISRTRLEHNSDTNRLVYGRSNRDVWSFDVKSNSPQLEGSIHELAMSESKKPKIIGGDSSFLRSFLNMGTAAFAVPELATMLTKGGNYGQVIVRVLGGSTGYSAGYLISDRLFPPKCNDPAIIDWLSYKITDSDYSEIKRKSLLILIDKWQETGGKPDVKLRAVTERLRRPDYIPKNEDFSVFAELVSAPNQSL